MASDNPVVNSSGAEVLGSDKPTDRARSALATHSESSPVRQTDIVLFDVGHTLVHSDRRHARAVVREVASAVHRQVRTLGFAPPPIERYLRAAKWSFLAAAVRSLTMRREVRIMEVMQRSHARMGIDLDMDATRELATQGAIAIWNLFHVDPDARAMLSELSGRGYRLGLISNTWLPGPIFDGYLQHEGLLDYFPVRVYSSEVGYMKPDRRIFDIALRALQAAPGQCIFVGDRMDNDIRGAARIGMQTIHVAHRPRRFWQYGRPDRAVQRLSEIPDVLSSLE